MGAVLAALPGLVAAFGEGIYAGPLPVVGCVLAGATVGGIIWLVAACWAPADAFNPVSRAIGSIVVAIVLAMWTLATAFRDAPVQLDDGRAVFLGGSTSRSFLLVTLAAVLTLLIAGFVGRIQGVTGSDPAPAVHSPIRMVAAASLMALAFAVTVFLGPSTAYVVPSAFVPVALGWAAFSTFEVSSTGRLTRGKRWLIAVVVAGGWVSLVVDLDSISGRLLTLGETSWQAAGLLGSTAGVGLLAPLCVGAYLVDERRRKPTSGARNGGPDSDGAASR